MLSVAGVVKGDSVVLENDSIRNYDGTNIIITFLDGTVPVKRQKKQIDFDSYGEPTERGKHVDDYMKEIRENDRF